MDDVQGIAALRCTFTEAGCSLNMLIRRDVIRMPGYANWMTINEVGLPQQFMMSSFKIFEWTISKRSRNEPNQDPVPSSGHEQAPSTHQLCILQLPAFSHNYNATFNINLISSECISRGIPLHVISSQQQGTSPAASKCFVTLQNMLKAYSRFAETKGSLLWLHEIEI